MARLGEWTVAPATTVQRSRRAGFILTRESKGGTADKVYSNAGNPRLLDLLDSDPRVVLDVGCGAGDNAALIAKRHPGVRVFGITGSEPEAEIARPRMEQCWVADLEAGLPGPARQRAYDAILFSHVLEHLREPAELVREASDYLAPNGIILVAVPNVLSWAQRIKFLAGRFEYETAGVMDDTHLRFFTYRTAAELLLAKSPDLMVAERHAVGSVPLWILRRFVLPRRVSAALDAAGSRLLPNLFGSEVLLKVELRGENTRAATPI